MEIQFTFCVLLSANILVGSSSVDSQEIPYGTGNWDAKAYGMEGVSLRPFFAEDRTTPRTLFWEHMQNRGIRDGNWKLIAARGGPWELYDMAADPTELNDLVETRSDLARDLVTKWAAWARRVGVQNVDRLGKL